MPLFAEQPHNAHLVKKAGIGEIVIKTEVTAEKLIQNIHLLSSMYFFGKVTLRNAGSTTHKKKIEQFKRLMLDRPISSLDAASHAVRRAVKMKNQYPTIQIRGMYLSLWIYFLIPQCCVLLVVLIVSL